jgi:hypothetical protein
MSTHEEWPRRWRIEMKPKRHTFALKADVVSGVSCSCSLLIRGPILPAVRQKLDLSPCAVTDDDVSERNPKTFMLDLVQPLAA